MNFKKYLQQLAEKDEENLLTEEDKQFCMQLADDVKEKPVIIEKQKTKAKLWAGIGSAIAVALVGVIVIPVVLTQRSANEVYYYDENIDHRVCQLEEINSSLNNFELKQSDGYELNLECFYDTVSNDKLYYTVSIDALISNYNLTIVVNEKYNFEFEISEELISEPFTTEYTISYERVELTDTVSRIEAKYKGVINSNTEIIYIVYNQKIDLGKKVFIDDIQNVLKIKN